MNQSSFIGILALIVLSPMVFPHLALAANQTSGQQAQVLQINISDPSVLDQSPKPNTTQNSISFNSILQQDPLVAQVDAYLADHQSPLAGSANILVTYPHWQLALGISLVESHMCEYTPKVKTKHGWVESYNCSGIELGNGSYKIYDGYSSWFADINNLLSQPNYVNRPIEKFLGYYVQPGTPEWLFGVKKTVKELAAIEQTALAQRQQIIQSTVALANSNSSLPTFPAAVN